MLLLVSTGSFPLSRAWSLRASLCGAAFSTLFSATRLTEGAMPKEQRGRGEGGVFGARILFFAVFVDSGSSRKKGENQTAEAHLF